MLKTLTRPPDRPYHFGPFPMEELPRDAAVAERELSAPPQLPAYRDVPAGAGPGFEESADFVAALYREMRQPDPAPALAPVAADPETRTREVKGLAYFLDAAQAGICAAVEQLWPGASHAGRHTHVVVVLVEHGRQPERGNLASGWLANAHEACGRMRAAEIAVCVAGHVAALGYDARAHWAGQSEIDLDKASILAGLAVRTDRGVRNPFLDDRFSLAAVTTDYPLACDVPLAAGALGGARGLRYFLGWSGAHSGLERWRRNRRATHLGAYPMEDLRRVDRPTTLILDEEVPRVPKRALFFARAAFGDLGDKAQQEVKRFAGKQPLAAACISPMMKLVENHAGPVADRVDPSTCNPGQNAMAVKSLVHHLGGDIVGICEIPDYAWYSHQVGGEEIIPYHKYAIVVVIDQGFDTMEGATGDDWISGVQSMRAYMRGEEISVAVARFLRGLGHDARPQTNRDSDVLHIPLILLAGLGELSRIGELVLNPFMGPRFKSVVITTNMPLAVDKPIDFGLQYFCGHCLKCARECPCDAIPFGDKVMFNGYEMWKPDVERCTRYRVTNPGGSACGRCMKTCPLNKVVDLDGPITEQIASWLGVHAMWAKPLLVPIAVKLDDLLGHGRRVPVKKWWQDLEIVDGVCVVPKRTNQRDISPDKPPPKNQKMAYYPAAVNPPADRMAPFPVDRKEAQRVRLETPEEARRRTSLIHTQERQ
ncbi:MAG: Fe-S protein [Pseudomonadales bacterium]|nr:hypothetical protein [Halioglobus sp.]MCP5121610.1 Fe-S protein [Pseudomonadales bacterium]MCP5194949.1 Fe-S protein [Pseudomonadales bacterium]